MATIDGYEYVDLGLPSGTLWATMNVGANSITDYGGYYKMNSGATSGSTDSSYPPFGGDPLIMSGDTARQVIGGAWHMPTTAQCQELTANTTYSWDTINGVSGGKFTANNGNYVFFPAGGYMYNGSYTNVGSQFYILSSNYAGYYSNQALILQGYDGSNFLNTFYTWYAVTVRGVHDNNEYVDLGLPSGTLWAKKNVYALTESDYGVYYCHGALVGYNYDYYYNQYYNGTENPLPSSRDIATQVMGSDWCMPTSAQCLELAANTTHSEATINNVSGVKFTASNGNYVFFPYNGGYFSSSEPTDVGSYFYLWTSNNKSSDYGVWFRARDLITYADSKYYGLGIRGVNTKIGRTLTWTSAPSDLEVNNTMTITAVSSAGGGTITYSSSNPNVASVNGNVLRGVSPGLCEITATISASGDYAKMSTSIVIEVYSEGGESDGHRYVEIGGIKWATMNVGASSVTDPGQYFQWGDSSGYYPSQIGNQEKQKYFGTFGNYKFIRSGNTFFGDDNISYYNSSDNETVLHLNDDSASTNWGGKWRMPTQAELESLSANTTVSSIYLGKTRLYVLTDKTNSNKKLYLPISGIYQNAALTGSTSIASSSLYSTSKSSFASLNFYDSGHGELRTSIGSNYRYYGLNVRPILADITTRTMSWVIRPNDILIVGEKDTRYIHALPSAYGYDGLIKYTSSNPNVVGIFNGDMNREYGYINMSGLTSGSSVITASITKGKLSSSASISQTVNVYTREQAANGHEYVDLGLPSGTLWATMNIGATSQTDYGNFYQYGKGASQYAATSGQSYYNGMEEPLSINLDSARQVWGGAWHMPTLTQLQELVNNCYWNISTINGVKGYTVSSRYTGASIFLPAAGYYDNGGHRYGDYENNYYLGSSVLNQSGYESVSYHLYLYIYGNEYYATTVSRSFGCPVRGVIG